MSESPLEKNMRQNKREKEMSAMFEARMREDHIVFASPEEIAEYEPLLERVLSVVAPGNSTRKELAPWVDGKQTNYGEFVWTVTFGHLIPHGIEIPVWKNKYATG